MSKVINHPVAEALFGEAIQRGFPHCTLLNTAANQINLDQARIAALEARCREMEKECDDADFMDARIADLERQLSQYKEAFHKAFNQFENITVSDTLAVVKERAHQMIGWAYAVLPDYALETGAKS